MTTVRDLAVLAILVAVAVIGVLNALHQPVACQPLYRGSYAVCRVQTHTGRVIFIPWQPTVPSGYEPDNPDHGYAGPAGDHTAGGG